MSGSGYGNAIGKKYKNFFKKTIFSENILYLIRTLSFRFDMPKLQMKLVCYKKELNEGTEVYFIFLSSSFMFICGGGV